MPGWGSREERGAAGPLRDKLPRVNVYTREELGGLSLEESESGKEQTGGDQDQEGQ